MKMIKKDEDQLRELRRQIKNINLEFLDRIPKYHEYQIVDYLSGCLLLIDVKLAKKKHFEVKE